MTNVDCPNCGASYPRAKIGARTRFVCGRCRSPVEVPLVVEPIAELQVVEPIAELQVVQPIAAVGAEPTPPAGHAARPRRAATAAPKKSGASPAVWIGASAVVCIVIGALVVSSMNKSDAKTDSAPAAASAAAKPDPMKDADAWKALPAAERGKLAAQVVATTDLRSAEALTRAADFFSARGESASTTALANRVLERDASNAWARNALGQSEVGAEIDACLKQCEQAEEDDDADFAALKKDRAQHAGAWWADAETTKKERGLVADVRKAEERLQSPYWQGVGHWVRRQRKVDVMKDYPELHATVGPYLIFVSLNAPKDADVKNVPAAETERAAKILERTKKVIGEFYEGWMTEMGPRFGFKRYGPDNSDFDTLMKMNVFAKPEDFFAYNARVQAGVGGFTRAYYAPLQDRFITTYDGGGLGEDENHVDQVQCHEATHQLVHFYTWDVTRKIEDRPVDWLQCSWRPLWSGEGFAEFFSSHAVVDGKYRWMQPLDERLRQIWVFEEMVKEKSWIPWRLSEFFTMQHGGQLNSLAAARSKKAGDEWVAEGVMSNLFYGRAWSFVYFLWYAEEDGKPKYRDRYVEYLKAEFHVRFVPVHGELRPNPVDGDDFKRIMGFDDAAKLAAVEKEWNEFTAKLVAANHKPAWDEQRAKMRKNFGFDKPPEKKDEKPK